MDQAVIAPSLVEPDALPLNRVHLGDCLGYLSALPDGCVDLVVSSPPYNLGKEYEARRALEHYLEEQAAVLKECVRVLKDGGSIYWQVGAFSDDGTLIPLDIRFFPILESLGLRPRNRIIWVRQHGLHGRKKYSARHETILWFTKGDDYKFNLDAIRVPQKYQNKKSFRGDAKGELSCNPDGKNPGDVWAFQNVKHNHEEQTIHPCQFPEDLISRVVLASTDEGGVILDPYMGAGTTAVVARDLGRSFLGAELEPRYHEVIERRLTGTPNAEGSFANLKSLRDYIARTGEPIERFRFDVQVGKKATPAENSRIFPEAHHLTEVVGRLSFEEDCFAADVRGEDRPVDPLAHNHNPSAAKPQKRGKGAAPTLSLFTE